MGILSWLRSIVAGFFGADTDTVRRACDAAEAQTQAARKVAAAAVAQARRAALDLQELLTESEPGQAELRRAVHSAEEAQVRAEELIAEYRRRANELRAQLQRAEELHLLETANEERTRLLGLAQTAADVDLSALTEAHDEARAEAARLDALDSLRAGTFQPDDQSHSEDDALDSLKARAEVILGARNEPQE